MYCFRFCSISLSILKILLKHNDDDDDDDDNDADDGENDIFKQLYCFFLKILEMCK
jgi:hypothetical protein